jgi:hypothetical protein
MTGYESLFQKMVVLMMKGMIDVAILQVVPRPSTSFSLASLYYTN